MQVLFLILYNKIMTPNEFISFLNSGSLKDTEHLKKVELVLSIEVKRLVDYWQPAIEYIKRYLEGKGEL